MRIVDKYGLAECPYGTPFYRLDRPSANRYVVDSGLQILVSNTFYLDSGEPLFNGVCPLEPDFGGFSGQAFIEEDIKGKRVKFYEEDDDSNNYDDYRKFLVFDKQDFKQLLNTLKKYYKQYGAKLK